MQAVYPALTALDELCSKAAIRFPIDHVLAGKTELCKEALTYAYGPDFVTKYAVRRPNVVQSLGQNIFVGRRLNFAWHGDDFDDDNVGFGSVAAEETGPGSGLRHVGDYEENQSDGGLGDKMPDKVSIEGSGSNHPSNALLTSMQRDDQVLALLQQHIQELTDCAAESESNYSRTIGELTAARDTAEQRARDLEERIKTAGHQSGQGQGQGPAFLRAEIERLKSTNMDLEAHTRALKRELQELSIHQKNSLRHDNNDNEKHTVSRTTTAEVEAGPTNTRVISELENKVERSQFRIKELLNQSMESHREIVMLEQANRALKEALLSSQSSAPVPAVSQPSSSSSSPPSGPRLPPVTPPPPLITVAAREVTRLTHLSSNSEPPLAAPLPSSAVTGTKANTSVVHDTILTDV